MEDEEEFKGMTKRQLDIMMIACCLLLVIMSWTVTLYYQNQYNNLVDDYNECVKEQKTTWTFPGTEEGENYAINGLGCKGQKNASKTILQVQTYVRSL